MTGLVPRLAAAALILGLSGCSGISYTAQSVGGHLKMMSARQPVDEIIGDPAQPQALRARMVAADEIRDFATARLALPDNRSYRSYVDTHRDYATWAVFAAPEFSLTPRTWCFPVYGCVPYRGYFSKAAAERFAGKARRQRLDVHVSGVTAYSTLGLFADPLLNTMFRHDETFLAGLVFHELAHQRVYAKGDSAFNEGYAVAVETTGVRTWLAETAGPDALARYEAGRARQADFLALISRTRDELAAVYEGPGSAAEKRAEKAAAISRLRARYRRMRDRRWGGYAGYDSWFDTPVNNARLAAAGVYADLVPDFVRLFEACSRDYADFHAAVERLAALDRDRRLEALKAADGCD